eukprot:TRINITY_DN2393_c0_g1_i1.p1 TRINITY_DN2393_c0_g1~~TRINITY_DN2393_c0_g1_i1.p1  ORF type:complete len:364 (-),score=65.61 TRINITY_DN2393_c0_g1_i1:810-1901(-)
MRIGILSTANIATKVIDAIRKSGVAEVYAVASRELTKAQAYATKFNIPVAFGTYAELLRDDKVDAVYIPLPTNHRLEWVLKAAEAKKHVLCEKPFLSADEVRQMREACSKNGVHFQDNTMMVHHLRFNQIRNEKIFQVGSNGQNSLVRMHSAFSFYNILNQSDVRFNPSLEKDGCLGDMGWYNIRASLHLFDYELPSRVICFAKFNGQEDWSQEVDQTKQSIVSATGTLFFSRGRTATFYCSYEELLQQTLTVNSSDQSLTIDDFVLPRLNESTLFPREVYNDRAVYSVLDATSEAPVARVVEPCTQHVQLIRNFVSGSKTPSDPKYYGYGEQTWKTTRVLEAAVASARANGKIVYLEGTENK